MKAVLMKIQRKEMLKRMIDPSKRNDFLKHSKRRIRVAELISAAGCLLFTFFFGGKYLISPLFSSKARTERNSITYEAIKDKVVEGDIYDKNGNLILGNASAGVPATASSPDNVAYAYLLGYYSGSSNKENSYGLRGNLKDYSLFYLDSDSKGAATNLTTDSGLQDYAYELLDGNEGSITVIDNKTGAILCLTSQSTIIYDVNDVQSFVSSDVEGSQYRRGTYETDPPGSTFKIITAAAALTAKDNGDLSDSAFQYSDTDSYIPSGSTNAITNYNDIAYGDCDLEKAMNYSINCYFANLGVKTGEKQMRETADAFKIGTDIEIPFLTTLHSKIDLGDGSEEELAQTSFGQGKTEITPAQLTMIAQAVANNGEMMSPYIVSSITQGSLTLYKHFDKKLSTCITESVDNQLKTVLHSNAVFYGLDESNYGMVYAKTGTAECSGDRLHTYFLGFTDNASFCISMNNGSKSSLLYPVAQKLVSYINQMYSN
jgi:cell division protein FtsI/penicillin-binding protein 2